MTPTRPAVSQILPLRKEFLKILDAESEQLQDAERVKSGRQWSVAAVVNREWEEWYDGEISEKVSPDDPRPSKMDFYEAVAHRLRGQSHTIDLSPLTLKFWCEVERSFRDVPGIAEFRQVFRFDYFVRARRLFNERKVASQILPLVRALEEGWTAREMEAAFTDPQVTSAQEQAIRERWPKDLWDVARRVALLPDDDRLYCEERMKEIIEKIGLDK